MFSRVHRSVLAALAYGGIVASSGVFVSSAIADTPLVQDNFNDNSLDFSKWAVVTAGIPQNPKSVVEQNSRLELEGRAHFNTAAQFDPLLQPEQGLRIRGQWNFVSNDDFFQVLTRSSGQPGGSYGETTSGIEFLVGTQSVGGNMSISNRGGTTVTGQSNSGALNPVAGETYDFEIRDTGTNLYFTMSQVGGGKQRTVVASSLTNTPTDVISFHNREEGRRSNIDNLTIDSPSLLGPSNPATFPIFLQDNFNDNALDPAKWNAVTTGIPQGGASVVETNSRLQMTGRGHLVSAQQFDPTDGGLRVEGRWTFGSDDFMQVLTRSDGQPSGSYGETFNGIEFFAFDTSNQMAISQKINGVATSLGSASIDITAGEVFDFLITDDGTNLLFELTQVGGDGTTAQIVGVSSQAYANNFLAFHNRESSNHVAFLDDVVVTRLQAVPEPASAALWAVAIAMAICGWQARQRCRRVV